MGDYIDFKIVSAKVADKDLSAGRLAFYAEQAETKGYDAFASILKGYEENAKSLDAEEFAADFPELHLVIECFSELFEPWNEKDVWRLVFNKGQVHKFHPKITIEWPPEAI